MKRTLSFNSGRIFLSKEFLNSLNMVNKPYGINFRINFKAALVRNYGLDIRHDVDSCTNLANFAF